MPNVDLDETRSESESPGNRPADVLFAESTSSFTVIARRPFQQASKTDEEYCV